MGTGVLPFLSVTLYQHVAGSDTMKVIHHQKRKRSLSEMRTRRGDSLPPALVSMPWDLCKPQFIKSLSLWTSYLRIAVNVCTLRKRGSGQTRNNIHVLAVVLSNWSLTTCPASASMTPFSSVFLNNFWFIIASLRSLFRYFFQNSPPWNFNITDIP